MQFRRKSIKRNHLCDLVITAFVGFMSPGRARETNLGENGRRLLMFILLNELMQTVIDQY